MPKAKYEVIYTSLKNRIEQDEFPYQELLPSENHLIHEYNCSRNTLRRAISMLVSDGYLQTLQGKGVRNIYVPVESTSFILGKIETIREASIRNEKEYRTEVVLFTDILCNERLSKRSGFGVGEELYYIQRIHYIDNEPLILNHNYFLKKEVIGLTKEIAEGSIYRYLEKDLEMSIINSKRIVTVEKVSEVDEKHLHLNIKEYNCMAVITSFTYNSRGIMFEFTQSRHRPEYFSFIDNAVR